MLAYYACADCGTVSAAPDQPERCGNCTGTRLSALTTDAAGAAYFADALREE